MLKQVLAVASLLSLAPALPFNFIPTYTVHIAITSLVPTILHEIQIAFENHVDVTAVTYEVLANDAL